jgi:hypothetical protein
MLTAAAAAPTTCSSLQNTGVATPGGTRCVNGVTMSARGWMKPDCLGPWPQPAATPGIYTKGQCGGNGRAAEYIAQARFLSRESNIGFNPGSNWIDADLEWETAIPIWGSDNIVGRADILHYDHTQSPLGRIEVLEVKGTWNPTLKIVNLQVRKYVNGLIALGMDAVPATFQEPYQDEFRIQLDPCAGSSAPRYETYGVHAADSSRPGVLLVENLGRDRCPNPESVQTRYR